VCIKYTIIFLKNKNNLNLNFEMRLYICKKFYNMTKSAKNLFWVLFFLSLALGVAVYFLLPSMVSLTIVPIVTCFAKALDLV